MNDLSKFDTLVQIIARLRGPDGCPWDRAQSHQSLRSDLMEEAYEVVEALDAGDPAKVREELGDLMLVIALHAQIAAESGDFDIGSVITAINEKVINRHPHVFGDATARTAGEVVAQWEALKRKERKEGASMLEGVPRSLPALTYSYEIQSRVARVGFDWPSTEGIFEKLAEEIGEIAAAGEADKKAAEFGDLLFTMVNLGRHLGIDSEAALRGTNRRFYQRFAQMEKLCRERGLELSGLSLDELDRLWEEAKKAENRE